MGRFTIQERKLLENNKNIKKVTGSNILFTAKFKREAIEKYRLGHCPRDIFIEAGIDVSKFDKHYARKSISRWEDVLERDGAKALSEERRGRGSTGRPKKSKTFKSEKEELAYLREENDFLKKLHALAEKSQKKRNSR